MKTSVYTLLHADGLWLRDEQTVTHKLKRFAAAGPHRIYFLFDFDRTLTTSKFTGDNTTTWQIMHGLLPDEGQKVSKELRTKYLLMEAAGELSLQDSHVWSSSLLDLHAVHGTSRHAMVRAAKAIRLREGSQKLFQACERVGIPTVILSAGIRDVIEEIMAAQKIYPTELLSVRLQFSQDGRVNGWDKNTLVLTHNKNETIKQHLAHIYNERDLVVLVGDTIEDARMVDGTDNVLRIRVCDEVKDDQSILYNDDEFFRKESFAAGFDIVVDEDLSPIAGLVNMLAAQPARLKEQA